jgi:hypothetical protein
MNMGLASPHLEAFAVAKGSASAVFQVLNRVPDIDSLSTAGLKPAGLKGDIELKEVHFQYPSRPEVKVSFGRLQDVLLLQKCFQLFYNSCLNGLHLC